MLQTQSLNAHEAPPQPLKEIFKKYQKIQIVDIDSDEDIIDFTRNVFNDGLIRGRCFTTEHISNAFSKFAVERVSAKETYGWRHKDLPGMLAIRFNIFLHSTKCPVVCPDKNSGLLIVPALIPEHGQKVLLDHLVHRDLSDARHKTNVHMHYDVVYPAMADAKIETASFFYHSPVSSPALAPKDASVHKPLSISKFLNKSLRWVTLGGQYDWTNKVYPDDEPPSFPEDVSHLVQSLFPEMKAQAAIVNFYSPGDTLSLHRDVSEEVDKGLASISLGCDCLFVIGLSDESNTLVLRLRSGDAVYMSQEARYAWHGVPKILSKTCPNDLQDWPAARADGRFEAWKGWMSNKRINLNVRQMFDD